MPARARRLIIASVLTDGTVNFMDMFLNSADPEPLLALEDVLEIRPDIQQSPGNVEEAHDNIFAVTVGEELAALGLSPEEVEAFLSEMPGLEVPEDGSSEEEGEAGNEADGADYEEEGDADMLFGGDTPGGDDAPSGCTTPVGDGSSSSDGEAAGDDAPAEPEPEAKGGGVGEFGDGELMGVPLEPDVAAVAKAAKPPSKLNRRWGFFQMTFRDPGGSAKFGQWSTTCRVHTTATETCTKSYNLSSADAHVDSLKQLVLWSNRPLDYRDKQDHVGLKPRDLPVLDKRELGDGTPGDTAMVS